MEEYALELNKILSIPKNIVIVAHRNPDGDAIGSSLGLYHFLNTLGHTCRMILPSEYPEIYSWMPEIEEVIIFDVEPERSRELFKDAEMIFCLDFNSLERIDKLGEDFHELKATKVLIDHHLYPEHFCDYTFSDTTASSTCEMVFDFIAALGFKNSIDLNIAECLFTGILTDTGSFKYSTSPKLYRIAGDLLERGVDDFRLQDLIFNGLKEKHLRLLGYCLTQRMQILEEFNTGIITLTKEDYVHFDIQRGDTEGIVNYLLKLKNIKLAAFITEQPTIVKLSLRSKGDFSVQEIARKHFKGGGHKNAAGGSSYYGLSATVRKFKQILPEYKNQLLSQSI